MKSSRTGNPPRRKILIVDDHPMMRQGLAQLVNSEADLTVCGEAADAHEALDAVRVHKPDLILADITLPGRNGLEMIKDLRALDPEAQVLVISMHDETLYAERVIRAGGRGYIMKQEGGRKLMEAIRQVLTGQIYVSAKMSARILENVAGKRGRKRTSKLEQLSDREFEVFQLLGNGRGTREIANQLNLSVKTVEVHRANIKRKLKLRSAPELIHFAIRWMEAENRS